jgi:hypothetical protein
MPRACAAAGYAIVGAGHLLILSESRAIRTRAPAPQGSTADRTYVRLLLALEMGSVLDKRQRRTLGVGDVPPSETRSRSRRREVDELRFVPARWLVFLLAIARAMSKGRKFTKFGLLVLIWSFTPRALRIATAGVAAAAAIVVIGALAAIALLALQLS